MTKQAIIETILGNLIPIAKDDAALQHLLDDRTGIMSCSISLENSLEIKKIDIFFVGIHYAATLNIDAIIVQLAKPNEKALFQVALKTAEKRKELYRQIKAANIPIEYTFMRPTNAAIEATEWDNLNVYKHYGNSVTDYYSKCREFIAQTVVDKVDHLTSNSNNIANNIDLFDIGTGFGDCLNLTAEKLTNKRKTVTAIGTDINKSNIEQAQRSFLNKPYVFEIADTLNLETIVLRHANKQSLKIITGSGAVTRKVLNGTAEGLQVLQQAYRVAELMVLGGTTEVLVTSRLAKKIGWHFEKMTNTSSADNLNIIVLIPEKTLKAKIKNGHFNLAMHAHPLFALQNYSDQELKDITSIDLSMAYLKSNEINSLLALLPNLSKAFIAGVEKWCDEFEANTRNRNIEITKNASNYVVTRPNMYELKKFSKGFYGRYGNFLTFKARTIHDLQKAMKAEKTKYNPEEARKSALTRNELITHINQMEELAGIGNDDVAAYALAIKLTEGVQFIAGKDKNGYLHIEKYKDLEKGFLYWSQLLAKGYFVAPYIERIQNEWNSAPVTNFEALRQQIA